MWGVLYSKVSEYERHLQSPDWLARREEIIKRDRNCCTVCGLSRSYSWKCPNIIVVSFLIRELVESRQTIPNIKTIAQVKSYLDIEEITIFKNPCADSLFGKSVKGHIFLADSNIQESSKKGEIAFISGRSNSGADVYILASSEFVGLSLEAPIPVFLNERLWLQVHHKLYILGRKAWEYSDEQLVTVCNVCHRKIHEQVVIPVYSEQNGQLNDVQYTPCTRCNGAGYFPEYRSVENGVSFRCRGSRYEELIEK